MVGSRAVRSNPGAQGAGRSAGDVVTRSDAAVRALGLGRTIAQSVTFTDAATAVLTTSDPAWVATLKAGLPTSRSYTTTAKGGTYTGSQVNAHITTLGNGTSTTWKRLTYSGSTINLTGDTGIQFTNMSYVELDLTGATVNHNTAGHGAGGGSTRSSALFLENSDHITIRGGTIIGQMTNLGTSTSQADVDEWIHGLLVRLGCSYIEMVGTAMQAIRGWPVWIAIDGSGLLTNNVWIHGGVTSTGGEMGIAVTGGEYILIEDNSTGTGLVDKATYHCIDMEPDVSTGHIRDVLIQRNKFGSYGHRLNMPEGSSNHIHYFASGTPGYNGPTFSDMKRITIRDNTIGSGPPDNQGMKLNFDTPSSGNPWVREDIVITGNTSSATRTESGGAAWFDRVLRLTVTGNTQTTVGHVAYVAQDSNGTGLHTITPNTT